MDRPTRTAMGDALRTLALKDMDPSLLTFAILRERAEQGVDVAALTEAMELAAYLHRDDVRSTRGQLPVDAYVTHPFRLVLRLLRYGCRDDAVLSAAALHDTVEDHPTELVALLDGTPFDPPATPTGSATAVAASEQDRAVEALAEAFGPDVSRIVRAVTNLPQPPGLDEAQRHGAYVAHVGEMIADPLAFLVKFADFVDNAGSLRYLADDDRRARMERKYAPLVPLLRSALAAHRPSLGLGADGLAQMYDHLDAIADRLTPA